MFIVVARRPSARIVLGGGEGIRTLEAVRLTLSKRVQLTAMRHLLIKKLVYYNVFLLSQQPQVIRPRTFLPFIVAMFASCLIS